jgi:SAM-dependent methyltransferase
MNPDETHIDWDALAQLRAAFLEGTAGHGDYWQSERALASYDATFAQRIGWKWDYVLTELRSRGWVPPGGTLLDWGCGTGIAHRAFLDHFSDAGVDTVWLWDRSQRAMDYAAQKLHQRFPSITVHLGLPETVSVALVSHVLTELPPAETSSLCERLAHMASAAIWVEPGTRAASQTLVQVRERWRPHFAMVAPCTHSATCGLLAPGMEEHWCHHFAAPPPAVFTDPAWGKFARVTGIDLRALPLSFLAVDRRGAPAPASAHGWTRLLGRPRVYKAWATILGCSAAGVTELEVSKRFVPAAFRALRKGYLPPLQSITQSEGKARTLRAWGEPDPGPASASPEAEEPPRA